MTSMALDLQTSSFSGRCRRAEGTRLQSPERFVPDGRRVRLRLLVPFVAGIAHHSLLCRAHLRLQNTRSCHEPSLIFKQTIPLVIYSELTVFKIAVECEMGSFFPSAIPTFKTAALKQQLGRTTLQLITCKQKPQRCT